MAGEERTLSIIVRAKDLASGALKNVNKNLDKIGQHAQRGLGNAITNIAKMGKVVAGVGIGLGVASVKVAMDFEDMMTKSLAIMGKVSTEMRTKMEAQALAVSKTTTFSASQAAEAYYGLASAGLSAAQSVEALPFVAKFAQAGVLDLATATDYLVNAQAALGLSSSDAVENMKNMQRVGDVLTQINNLATGSVEEFSAALTEKAATSMRKYGIAVEDGVAVLGVFAQAGLRGEKAGNTFASMLTGITTAVTKKGDVWKQYGIRIFDASGNLRSMVEITRDLTTALGPLTDEQRAAAYVALGINRLTATGVDLLLNQTDALAGYTDGLRKAGGATDEVAQKQLQSFRQQLALLKNNLVDVGIVIGKAVLPGLTRLTKKATEFVRDNGPAIQRFADRVGKNFDGLVTKAEKFIDSIDLDNLEGKGGGFLQTLRELGRELLPTAIEAFKSIPWSTVGDVFRIMGQGARAAMQMFQAAPPWLKTAIVTGWGLNKLTGGALGSIVGELGKGLIKGVLGMNAGVVNLRAGVVNGAGGAGGVAGAAGKGGGVLSSLKVMGSLLIAGVAIDQLFQQWGRFQAQVQQASDSVMEKVATIPDKTYQQAFRAVTDMRGTIETQSGDLVKSLLMTSGSGQMEAIASFKALAENLQKTAQTPAERAAAAAALTDLASTIRSRFTITEGDRLAVDAKLDLGPILEALRNPPPVALAPTTMGSMANIFGGQMPSIFGNAVGTKLDAAIGRVVTALDKNHDGQVGLREVVAAKLGLTVDGLMSLKQASGGWNATLAGKLGISNERLQALKAEAAATVTAIRNKDFSPIINVTVPVRVSLSGRTIASDSNRQTTRWRPSGPTVQ